MTKTPNPPDLRQQVELLVKMYRELADDAWKMACETSGQEGSIVHTVSHGNYVAFANYLQRVLDGKSTLKDPHRVLSVRADSISGSGY